MEDHESRGSQNRVCQRRYNHSMYCASDFVFDQLCISVQAFKNPMACLALLIWQCCEGMPHLFHFNVWLLCFVPPGDSPDANSPDANSPDANSPVRKSSNENELALRSSK